MNKLSKITTAIALTVPTVAFAQNFTTATQTVLANSNAAMATGLVSVAGDAGTQGGGTGWVNAAAGSNTVYNELDVDFTTAGEVYVSVLSNHAMALTSAVHLGGKGAVFHNTTAGFSGQCAEDVAAIQTADGNISGILTFSGVSGVYVIPKTLPASIVPATPNDAYVISACQPLGSS